MRCISVVLFFVMVAFSASAASAVPMPFPGQPFGGSKACALPNGFVVPEGFSPGGALHGMAGVTTIQPGPNGGLYPSIAYDPARITQLIQMVLGAGGSQGNANLVVAFLAYHECGHARLAGPQVPPPQRELAANCEALRQMRALGYVGAPEEAVLATFHNQLGNMGYPYGTGSVFWAQTVACANAQGAPASLDQRITP
jgi:hypothetical protein